MFFLRLLQTKLSLFPRHPKPASDSSGNIQIWQSYKEALRSRAALWLVSFSAVVLELAATNYSLSSTMVDTILAKSDILSLFVESIPG